MAIYMEPIKSLTSACRYCRYYKTEGRRGGLCQQLGAPVQGSWSACSLAIPPFAPSWEGFEEVWSISDPKTALGSSLNQNTLQKVEASAAQSYEQTKSVTVQI